MAVNAISLFILCLIYDINFSYWEHIQLDQDN
jgi:hypothetical protein